MLLRICLILTIVAGLGAAYLGFFPVKDIITTTREARDDFNKKWKDETALYQKTDKALKKTTADLAATTAKLTETQSQLEAANTKNAELDKQNTDLTDKLTRMTARADNAEQTLERWRQLPPPEQIKGIIIELAQTKKARDAVVAENKLLLASRNELQRQLENLVGSDVAVVLPEGLKGRVLAVDPKYDFVVLDIGDDQGVKERGEMMVNRQGKLIGKIRISSVQKDRCVATILPAWKRGDIMEGDQVIY
jgi:predicted RNase H-like nuclease (RuvC/YqgF family)